MVKPMRELGELGRQQDWSDKIVWRFAEFRIIYYYLCIQKLTILNKNSGFGDNSQNLGYINETGY